jgi:hypothetical protein
VLSYLSRDSAPATDGTGRTDELRHTSCLFDSCVARASLQSLDYFVYSAVFGIIIIIIIYTAALLVTWWHFSLRRVNIITRAVYFSARRGERKNKKVKQRQLFHWDSQNPHSLIFARRRSLKRVASICLPSVIRSGNRTR